MDGVSICITNWNYGRYLRRCLDSIESQTTKVPYYIVDDASTDESLDIYETLPSAVVHRGETQLGAVSSYQRGLELCETEWIIFLDADDMIPPNYVEEKLRTAKRKRAPWVYSDIQVVDADDRPLGRMEFPRRFRLRQLEKGNFIHSSCLIRTDLIRQAGGWQEDPLEDWHLYRRVGQLGFKAAKARRTHLFYRRHGKSRMHGGRGR